MRSRCALLLVAACGGSSSQKPPGPDAAAPMAVCDAPALVDTSAPTTVVGNGTPGSCTEAALAAAAAGGGTITFDCGGPVTIAITQPITFTNETVLDGGGTVTLDGGGTTRILYLDSDYNTKTPRLTVQRLTFTRGKGPDTGDDTARGGGAIYRDGGSLTVIDSAFDDNHAGSIGQDLAGGAIYGFGGGDIVVAGSTFTNNSASDGGAIGSLNGDVTLINTTLDRNAATGTGGNPGMGGCGGALYMDGADEKTSLCGVKITNNSAGAIGGGVFRLSKDHTGSFAMDRSTVDSNQVTPADSGNAGGLYLEGLALDVTASTVSRNKAFYNGGMWINTDTVMMTNVTIAENTAFGSNGGGLWLGHSPTGTLLNCTIANNHATASGQVAGGIFGDGLTLVNTIVANNTAMYTPTCDAKRTDGSGNLQWPDGSLCTTAPLVADPMLGALGDNGGDTETMVPGAAAMGIGSGCPPTDQRGHARGAACAAGAVEP
ncbi:MAG TPA: choice-of-anchor Q domain-containing protein [Kofleriaceae bacterium]|nr:choice-of-anchor Q domain-containing protein [Kofleriaceae bacterium]